MANDKPLSDKDIKKKTYPWVMNLCASLAAISIFLNSIGFNLMQINGAATEYIIRWINKDEINTKQNTELKLQVEELQLEVIRLKSMAHPAKG